MFSKTKKTAVACALAALSLLTVGLAACGSHNKDSPKEEKEPITYWQMVPGTMDLDPHKTVTMKIVESTNTTYQAEIWGNLYNEELPLKIKRGVYSFSQVAGDIWKADISTESHKYNTVPVYGKRCLIGKTTGTQWVDGVYDAGGNQLLGEIAEGYGKINWLLCLQRKYYS